MNREPQVLKQEADEYLDNIKTYFSQWGKAFLIVGGTVWVTYKVIKGLSSHQQNRKKPVHALQEEHYAVATVRPSSRIAKMIKQQIALFLIAIIKQKLTEALSKRSANHGDEVV